MKKIFACSNGIEFFSDGKSVLGVLSKGEAIDFVSNVAIDTQKSGKTEEVQAALMLLKAINKSYIQLPKVVKIEVAIIVL